MKRETQADMVKGTRTKIRTRSEVDDLLGHFSWTGRQEGFTPFTCLDLESEKYLKSQQLVFLLDPSYYLTEMPGQRMPMIMPR